MKYNREFDLNPADIDVIEACLSKELHHRSDAYLELEKQEDAEAMEEAKLGIAEITELLGKIHQQKVWFGRDPDDNVVPLG
ncbi:MAG: hypothetical protein GY952_06105 [Rhodobacteraceae bacterium]|nr:hypothetical protein [Paracoccaceae bacterium]